SRGRRLHGSWLGHYRGRATRGHRSRPGKTAQHLRLGRGPAGRDGSGGGGGPGQPAGGAGGRRRRGRQGGHRGGCRGGGVVTGIKTTGEKELLVFTGRSHPELAEEICLNLGTEPVPMGAYEFANGEIYVRFDISARGCDAFVIQSHTMPINKLIIEQLIL